MRHDASSSPLRVLIADDSALVRDVLRAMLTRDGEIKIVGEASNGLEAVEMARQLKPQLITMDLTMPVMDGMRAIEEIMHTKGVPILVISDRADATTAYEALELGALEVMPKPSLDSDDSDRLIERVKLLAGVAVITRLRRRTEALTALPVSSPSAFSASPQAHAPRSFKRVVAIACSTGGPQALVRLLSALPASFPAPIVIAQHISHGFIGGMAQWLASLCAMPVRVAEAGEPLCPGHVYLSPSECDLTIDSHHRVALKASPAEAIYHPSCDALLASVAEVYGRDAIGLILTGMGRDGVSGMRAIHQAGGLTLAQDEASSVIFGMNQEALKAGAVRHVVALDELAERLLTTVQYGIFMEPSS